MYKIYTQNCDLQNPFNIYLIMFVENTMIIFVGNFML
jgi:hypothetical protein